MTLLSYKFIRTDFSEPLITGENKGIGRPLLVFLPTFIKDKRETRITLHIDFMVEGFESDFQFTLKSKTLFKATDAEDIVVSDVYDMHVKAFEDFRIFLDEMAGQKGIPLVGVQMPSFDQLLDGIIEFVGRLHARP